MIQEMTATNEIAQRIKYSVPKIKLLLVHENIPSSNRRLTIAEPGDVAKLLGPLRLAPEEIFVSVHLNAKNEVLGLHEVSHGTLSESLVHPREVFKAALLANSYAIIVCHNHPSGGSIKPSLDDINITRQLIQSGKLLGVSVIDHLIVAPKSIEDFYSFKENYPVLWS
jgi:DNA repair protein RadC